MKDNHQVQVARCELEGEELSIDNDDSPSRTEQLSSVCSASLGRGNQGSCFMGKKWLLKYSQSFFMARKNASSDVCDCMNAAGVMGPYQSETSIQSLVIHASCRRKPLQSLMIPSCRYCMIPTVDRIIRIPLAKRFLTKRNETKRIEQDCRMRYDATVQLKTNKDAVRVQRNA